MKAKKPMFCIGFFVYGSFTLGCVTRQQRVMLADFLVTIEFHLLL